MSSTRSKSPENMGIIRDLFEHLAGKDGQQWFEALKRFLRKENPWRDFTFPTWKTIHFGEHDSIGKLIKQVVETSDGFWDHTVRETAAVVRLIGYKKKVHLVKVSFEDLGFTSDSGVPISIFVAQANRFGLTLCPEETALELRHQYLDQPNREKVTVVSRPLAGLGAEMRYLVVACQDERQVIMGKKASTLSREDGPFVLVPR